MTNEIENNNNTQSTENIDPDIEFLIEDDAAWKRKEAEKKAARMAKNARKSDFIDPGDLTMPDQGIRPKKANSIEKKENKPTPPPPPGTMQLFPFNPPKVITFGYVLRLQMEYLKYGFPVFPVGFNNTYVYPITPKNRPQGIENEPTLRRQMIRQIKHYRALIPEGVMVIDLDRKNGKDGLKVFNSWLEKQGIKTGVLGDIENGSYPFTTRTGSGGYHLYFKLPIGMDDIPTWVGAMDGVDILMPGYAVVTAGSRKPGGNIYVPNFTSFEGLITLPREISKMIIDHRNSKLIKDFIASRRSTEFRYSDAQGDKSPERIIIWNLEAWDCGKREYGGHNDFFMHVIAECKKKKDACDNGEASPSTEWELDNVWDAIKRCEYYRTWGEPNSVKENEVAKTLKQYYKDYPMELRRNGGYGNGKYY